MNLKRINALQIKENTLHKNLENIISEEPLQININGKPFTIAMRTPGNDLELTRGLLYTEGVIKTNSEIEHIEELFHAGMESPFAVTVRLAHYDENEFMRTGISNSSCGICGKKEWNNNRIALTETQLTFKLRIEQIKLLREKMIQGQNLFRKTGGCHAAAFFDDKCHSLCVFEDVGRHNAVDKGIGFLLNNAQISKSKILFLSGRISFEILYKAYSVGIVYILAISAPSSMCIEYAEKYGICIIGFCRDDKATIYSKQEEFVVEEISI